MPSLPQDGVIQGSSPLELNTELPYHCTMKRKVRKKKKKGIITANVAGTKFEIVRLVIDEMGFIKTPDEDERILTQGSLSGVLGGFVPYVSAKA